MVSLDPKSLTQPKIQGILTGGVAPRPIALASTVSKEGVNNLSPFSFFNAFSSNPPMLAFSPARRGRDNTVKDTYVNLVDTGEVAIHAVTYEMTEQINLASCEYGEDADEFVKAGFTPVESDIIKPKRVLESPFHMECKLSQMVHLGDGPGSGNLAICEVLKFHIDESIMEGGRINPALIDHVGRNGSEYYTRAFGHALFTVPKPGLAQGMGYDGLPDFIKKSHVFTANDLARLALSEKMPEKDNALAIVESAEPLKATEHSFATYCQAGGVDNIFRSAIYLAKNSPRGGGILEKAARVCLHSGDIEKAWILAIYKGILFDGF